MEIEIGIGIIGVGLLGDIHLMALETIIKEQYFKDEANISIVALADTDEPLLKRQGEKYHVDNLYTDYKDLIADPDVNTVYIVTPTAFHYEMYKAAIAAGKDIFCEKPLTDTLAKIDEMITLRDQSSSTAVKDQSNRIVQVGLVLRHEPLFWYIKQIVEHQSADWGKLINIIFRDDQAKPYTGSGTHPSKWRRDPKMAYHGTLFEHSIHDIDQIQWWFGSACNIYARVRSFAGLDPIEDSVSATIEMENGASLCLCSIWHNVIHDTRYIEIFFENAYIKLDYDNTIGKININEVGKPRRRVKARDTEKYYMEAHGLKDFPKHWLRGYGYENIAFIRSLLSRKPASPSLEDAKTAHGVVEACYRSSQEKRTIALKELIP